MPSPEPIRRRGPSPSNPRLQQLEPHDVALAVARRAHELASQTAEGLAPAYKLIAQSPDSADALLTKTALYRMTQRLHLFAIRGGPLDKSVAALTARLLPQLRLLLGYPLAASVDELAAQVDPQSAVDPLALVLGTAIARERLAEDGPPVKLAEVALLAGMNRAALTYRSRNGDLHVQLVRRSGKTRGQRNAGDAYVIEREEARRFLAELQIPGF